MSERGIIFLVVVALLAVAFFFPYESSDDEYYRTHDKKQAAVVQKPPGETDNPHHAECKGMGESRLVVDDPIINAKPAEFTEPGARARLQPRPQAVSPDAAADQRRASIHVDRRRHRGPR